MIQNGAAEVGDNAVEVFQIVSSSLEVYQNLQRTNLLLFFLLFFQ
jgi:hypothetical protein